MAWIYCFKQISLPANQWTAIVTPYNCSYFSFKSKNSQPILLRTNSSDSTTEDLLPGGQQESVLGGSVTYRWMAGERLFWAQPQAAVDDVGILKVL